MSILIYLFICWIFFCWFLFFIQPFFFQIQNVILFYGLPFMIIHSTYHVFTIFLYCCKLVVCIEWNTCIGINESHFGINNELFILIKFKYFYTLNLVKCHRFI